jgi:hypothetical protein
MTRAARLVVEADPRLAEAIRGLAEQRMVFFAGLPGTGKSLLVHQLTHLAASAGRSVHLLQWDVAPGLRGECRRPAISARRRRHPPRHQKGGRALARRAVVDWHERNPDPRHLLIGETPFVGNRFAELARRLDDAAMPPRKERPAASSIYAPLYPGEAQDRGGCFGAGAGGGDLNDRMDPQGGDRALAR